MVNELNVVMVKCLVVVVVEEMGADLGVAQGPELVVIVLGKVC
jgi:hypothetical protein